VVSERERRHAGVLRHVDVPIFRHWVGTGSSQQLSGVRFGAHVRAGTTLLPAIARADEIGADVVQVFTQSPRAWKPTQYGPEVLAAYREAAEHHPGGLPTFCHATYLINLASSDPGRFGLSTSCLAANLAVARAIGAQGLVLHAGSHLGAGFDACLAQLAGALVDALEATGDAPEAAAACPILIENTAGAGGTVGRSLDELARILAAAGERPDMGICLDTQHMWAAGIPYGSLDEADALVTEVERSVGLARLRCLHVNDSAVAFGARRDRHANVGEGTIGERALGCLLGHPDLQGVPAILEVPGEGQGARADDVAALRRAHALGVGLRS
jgi:deoxyribonuclease-4